MQYMSYNFRRLHYKLERDHDQAKIVDMNIKLWTRDTEVSYEKNMELYCKCIIIYINLTANICSCEFEWEFNVYFDNKDNIF
jgi:hypothetical protein